MVTQLTKWQGLVKIVKYLQKASGVDLSNGGVFEELRQVQD